MTHEQLSSPSELRNSFGTSESELEFDISNRTPWTLAVTRPLDLAPEHHGLAVTRMASPPAPSTLLLSVGGFVVLSLGIGIGVVGSTRASTAAALAELLAAEAKAHAQAEKRMSAFLASAHSINHTHGRSFPLRGVTRISAETHTRHAPPVLTVHHYTTVHILSTITGPRGPQPALRRHRRSRVRQHGAEPQREDQAGRPDFRGPSNGLH